MLGIVLASATGGALLGFVFVAAVHRCDDGRCRDCHDSGARVRTTPDGWHRAELCGCATGRAYARQNTSSIADRNVVAYLPTTSFGITSPSGDAS